MIEFTLNIGDKVRIGGDVILEILPKIHPKAIPAQSVKIGVQAEKNIAISKFKKINSLI